MDGVHDMGGMHGFGPVEATENDPAFTAEWHGRVFAMNLALLFVSGGNVDRFRFIIESMPPADYLAGSYYDRWLTSVQAAASELGILDSDQLRAICRGEIPEVPAADVEPVPPEITAAMANAPTGKTRDMSGKAIFSEGDAVRARVMHSAGHTRSPRFVRGRSGTVVADNGNHHLPDARAENGEVQMQRLYTVSFTATELWGTSANPRDTVRVDLWESYLEPA